MIKSFVVSLVFAFKAGQAGLCQKDLSGAAWFSAMLKADVDRNNILAEL